MAPKRETLTIQANIEQQKDPELPWDSDNAEDEMPDKLMKSQVVEKMIDLDDF